MSAISTRHDSILCLLSPSQGVPYADHEPILHFKQDEFSHPRFPPFSSGGQCDASSSVDRVRGHAVWMRGGRVSGRRSPDSFRKPSGWDCGSSLFLLPASDRGSGSLLVESWLRFASCGPFALHERAYLWNTDDGGYGQFYGSGAGRSRKQGERSLQHNHQRRFWRGQPDLDRASSGNGRHAL